MYNVTKGEVWYIWNNNIIPREEKSKLWKLAKYTSSQSLTGSIKYGDRNQTALERIQEAVNSMYSEDRWRELTRGYENKSISEKHVINNDRSEMFRKIALEINSSDDIEFIKSIKLTLQNLVEICNEKEKLIEKISNFNIM